MKPKQFFTNKYLHRKEHGGSLSLRKRKSRRSFSVKNPLHVTLRSDFATGKRSLLRHTNLIYKILHKSCRRFGVKIYQQAICGNHIHLLVKAKYRIDLQNFFRVVAGHIAQQILEQFPIPESERKALANHLRSNALQHKTKNEGLPVKKFTYERKFWGALIYSRCMTWRRDFSNVMNYIEMNILEAIGWIPYQQHKCRYVDKIWGTMPLRRNGF